MNGHYYYKYLVVQLKDDMEAEFLAQIPVFDMSKEDYNKEYDRLRAKYSEKYAIRLASYRGIRINIYEHDEEED